MAAWGFVKRVSLWPGQDVRIIVLDGPVAQSDDLKKREFKLKLKQVTLVEVCPEVAAAAEGLLHAVNAARKVTEAIVTRWAIRKPAIKLEEKAEAIMKVAIKAEEKAELRMTQWD